jgi:hypothetical protein
MRPHRRLQSLMLVMAFGFCLAFFFESELNTFYVTIHSTAHPKTGRLSNYSDMDVLGSIRELQVDNWNAVATNDFSKISPALPALGSDLCTSKIQRVLLLGDSVDRHLVDNFCTIQRERQPNRVLDYDWSSEVFTYKNGISASRVCETLENGALGFLHLYGSAQTGPYLHGHSNSPDDPFTDTPIRICKGLKIFGEHVGEPSWIVFQALLWYIFFIRLEAGVNLTGKDPLTQKYKANITSRLQDIERCKPPCARVALRTVPHMQWGGATVLAFNDVIREVALEQAIPLLDYDHMAWNLSYATEESAIFQDLMHPNSKVSTTFALALFSQLSNT